jgi:hypothetical protein
MSAPLQLEANTVPGTSRQALPLACDAAVAGATFVFGLWTIATHIAVIAHFSFRTLAWIGPFLLLAGIACGLAAGFSGTPEPELRTRILPQRPRWTWLAFPAALVLLRALGIGYSAFWIGSFLFLVCTAIKLRRGFELPTEEGAHFSPRHVLIMAVMALACAGVTYVCHRPDVDDAVYAGTAADAFAHPELPVLSHDVLYGGRELPPMLPSYKVESFELFIAFLAHSFAGQPIFWEHAVVPVLLALLLPFAWATLLRIWAPRQWLAATVLALALFVLAGDPRGLGNFALVRLFLGKAVLVSLGIPLLYAFASKFEQTGRLWDWLLLAACTVACVGLSASAIFVAPLALAAAAFCGLRSGFKHRAILTFLPATYPLGCGSAVGHGFKALEPVFAYLPARAYWAVTTVYGEHTQYIFLVALLAAPFLVRDLNLRWKLVVLALFCFLVPLNPFTFKLLARLTTRDAVWRLLWCVPVVAIAAVALVNGIEFVTERWGRTGLGATVALLLCTLYYLAPYSSLAPSNGVTYSLQPLKVPTADYEAARAVIAATPQNKSILAPESVAVWVPTFVDRRPLVSVRELYDEEMGVHMLAAETSERRELRELVSGREFSPEHREQLLDSLPRYSVGLIVVTAAASDDLAAALLRHGYSHIRNANGYALFRVTQPESQLGAHLHYSRCTYGFKT